MKKYLILAKAGIQPLANTVTSICPAGSAPKPTIKI